MVGPAAPRERGRAPWVRREVPGLGRREIAEPWQPPAAVRLWVPVAISFLVQVPHAVFVVRTEEVPGWRGAVTIALALLGPLLLIAARRLPGPVVAGVALVAAVDLFLSDPGGPPSIALAFAIIGAIARGARVWAFASVAVCWVGSLALVIASGAAWQPARVTVLTLSILIVMGIGEFVRTRRERYRDIRRRMADQRREEIQAERVRIARELHDVLAHSLSQINVQAGVGLHLLERQPELAAEALASIKDTSRQALEEVRSVLGVLRDEDGAQPPRAPEPDLARIPELLEGASAHGIAAELDDRSGSPAPPGPIQSAAYRIVQESLTNVGRHAGAGRVTVRLLREGDSLRIVVEDDGRGVQGGERSPGGGRGIRGMRERAELLGGELEAGARPEGGFRVEARLPVPRREMTEDTP
ncbi:sensor histidine kinase [Homoserinibacter sp. YIM 151385]|uniref:sensor histidine kinase n=1 Tax=Homoserinibacter sp. YIM 151385 TaxID=2985506 RepID=UPI0022F04A2B|nr:histidine kinase [Homoserinibacter sp. YIM 151385]WBU38438.1 histidine kinase [Homoserinibacter sp. YIM 151385]